MEAPRLPSIFRQSRNKSFDFKPRYYDERKERMEELKRKYEGGGEDRQKTSSAFRGSMSSQWHQSRKRGSTGSSIRLVAIMAILFLITYLILFR